MRVGCGEEESERLGRRELVGDGARGFAVLGASVVGSALYMSERGVQVSM